MPNTHVAPPPPVNVLTMEFMMDFAFLIISTMVTMVLCYEFNTMVIATVGALGAVGMMFWHFATHGPITERTLQLVWGTVSALVGVSVFVPALVDAVFYEKTTVGHAIAIITLFASCVGQFMAPIIKKRWLTMLCWLVAFLVVSNWTMVAFVQEHVIH